MKRRDFVIGASLATALGTTAKAADTHYRGYPHQIKNWPAKHFQPWEFASKGNGKVKVTKAMVAALDDVRDAVGHPMDIVSGYRDPVYNARIGGVKFSRHIYGDAADISLRGLSSADCHTLMWHLLRTGFRAFGSYASGSFIHADMRSDARIWHSGQGTYPAWFRAALNDWGWRRDIGATRRPIPIARRS